MERTLTTKEKMNIKLLLLAYILLIVFSAVWLTNAQGQPFTSGGTIPVVTVIGAKFTLTIGLIIGGAVTHIFVELVKPNKVVSIGFTFYIYLIVNVAMSLITLILLVVMGTANYLAYEDMISSIAAFISYIFIGYLFYQQDLIIKKSVIKFIVMMILVQLVLHFAFAQ